MSERIRPSSPFASPEEEIAYLKERIAERERELISRNLEADHADYETIARQELREYAEHAPEAVLHKKYRLDEHRLHSSAEQISTSHSGAEEVLEIARTEGVRNALLVLEKVGDSFLTDEVHRLLIRDIRAGRQIANLKEGVPPWGILHMTLFEVALPSAKKEGEHERVLKELISSMEQFYAGMQSVAANDKRRSTHYTLEIAVSDKSDEIIFYVAVPTAQIDLFEKHLLSLFPHAVVTEQKNDYNIFVEGGVSLVSVGKLEKHHIYPIKTYDTFDHDPLKVLLNAFSKIEHDGGGAAVQVVIRPRRTETYDKQYDAITKRVESGMSAKKAIRVSTISGDFFEGLKELVVAEKKDNTRAPTVDQDALEGFKRKRETPIMEINIRVAVSAKSEARARQILNEIESSFNQFENTSGNRISFLHARSASATRELKAFSFREFSDRAVLPLSTRELTTLIHFPEGALEVSPQFKQSHAKAAAAPVNLPDDGTLLGVSEHRGAATEVYLTPEDRLRHFYIIGQTGTGKTTLMKNMIIQDIRDGHGVCLIDPHGTDIEDVLGAVPEEREQDIIYFDPSYMDRVMGLNMLEYDTTRPEQKTFVVNELFGIFQKLYGKVPESMGPIFEQYFRNATQLVLEDPESGSTLLDISRVLADARYRRTKLAKAKNPVVVQFWQDIATKAGGEAALENIVPYITSKFDVFTANDYMRPIIGQQKSSFNFRDIMDSRKILLVNLSKGRLGDINANLIGMIIVGKILMAALSRVDTPAARLTPFYLHMDEFQNITTDSIASILSEARKYKLGLTIAHQFIAQIDEKIRDAVFGNVGSIAAFRVGPEDAEFLEKQFAPTFSASDLMNIENHHAYVRLLARGTPVRPFSMKTIAPLPTDHERVKRLIAASYERFGASRESVDADIHARYLAPPKASIPVVSAE